MELKESDLENVTLIPNYLLGQQCLADFKKGMPWDYSIDGNEDKFYPPIGKKLVQMLINMEAAIEQCNEGYQKRYRSIMEMMGVDVFKAFIPLLLELGYEQNLLDKKLEEAQIIAHTGEWDERTYAE